MNERQAHELATICTRYADLRYSAKTANNNMAWFRFRLFADFLTPEELSTIKLAEELIERVANNTSQSDAVRYYNSLQTV